MSVEENLLMVKEGTNALNSRNWEQFDKLHAESVVVYSPTTPEPTKGLSAHRDAMKGLFTAFPDLQFTEERSFGQGDWVCTIWTLTGTHKGPLKGPGGQTIPATNKPVKITTCGVAKIENGQLTEERIYFDLLGMMAQLGLAPEGD